jgi:hypothetical protein
MPPLLLLLYRRDDRRCISVVADGAASTARSHDHGLQSGGHVCSGSHPPCAGAFSRPTQDEPTTDRADRSPAYQQIIEQLLSDPRLSHLYFDISWDEVAKYVVQTREIEKARGRRLQSISGPVLLGPRRAGGSGGAAAGLRAGAPICARLTPEASVKIRKGNYKRIFDAARANVRAWEKATVR